jgi:hypothetical protein
VTDQLHSVMDEVMPREETGAFCVLEQQHNDAGSGQGTRQRNSVACVWLVAVVGCVLKWWNDTPNKPASSEVTDKALTKNGGE